MVKYIAIVTFTSKIFRDLEIPKNSLLEERFGVLYFKKKPVLYIEDSEYICKKLLER